jgi:hypothetical protein
MQARDAQIYVEFRALICSIPGVGLPDRLGACGERLVEAATRLRWFPALAPTDLWVNAGLRVFLHAPNTSQARHHAGRSSSMSQCDRTQAIQPRSRGTSPPLFLTCSVGVTPISYDTEHGRTLALL